MMEGSEKFPGSSGGEEEELIDLDFDFEELMDEPLDETLAEVSPEDDIIELVDVVEKGHVDDEGKATAELIAASQEGDAGEMPLSLEDEVRAGLDNMMEGFDTAEVDLGHVGEGHETGVPFMAQEEGQQVAESPEGGMDRDLELELEAALEGFDTSQIDMPQKGPVGDDAIPDEIARLFDEGPVLTADPSADEAFDTDAIDLDQLPELELPESLESELKEMATEEQEVELELMEGELDVALGEESAELRDAPEMGLREGEVVLEEMEADLTEAPMEFEEGLEEDVVRDEVEEVAFEDLGAALGGEAIEFEEAPEVIPTQEGAAEVGATQEVAGEIDEFQVPTEVGMEEELTEEGLSAEAEVDTGMGAVAPGEIAYPGITEERLEAMITKVVEEVVERVAREAMVSVAERLITGAIEALKKSQEPRSD